MLKKIPVVLKGYAQWIPDNYIILVLIDRDNDDCHELKNQIIEMVSDANLVHKSIVTDNEPYSVLIRLAIEELEAWFFGDAEAVRLAYPKVSKNFERKKSFREPDSIKGGTWEALERVLQAGGYFKSGLRKIECASEISSHMQPLRNRSKSFQVFWQGLTSCLLEN